MLVPLTPKIFTVSEISQSIKGVLETTFPFIAVSGEVSNLRQPYSGHIYFTLKDAQAQLKAVLFKPQQRYLNALPIDGQQVICRGRLSVYEQRGDYQLIIDHLELQGSGSLWIAFEQLKHKLTLEGMFDQDRKQPLPLVPSTVVLITSPKGAAVFDFLTIAKSRCPAIPIQIMPVRVQGEGAAAEISEALALVNQCFDDGVIVLCRGGGSLEDLWAFNDERLARVIAASKLPVVSAVGHEVDFTIADFVADLRAPTPSAAAEMVIPDREALRELVDSQLRRARTILAQRISQAHHRLQILRQQLGDPRAMSTTLMLRLDHALDGLMRTQNNLVHDRRVTVTSLTARLHTNSPARKLAEQQRWGRVMKQQLSRTMQQRLTGTRQHLLEKTSLLEAVSPLAVLARGYAVVRHGQTGEVIRSSRQVTVGQTLKVRLHQGQMGCEINDLEE